MLQKTQLHLLRLFLTIGNVVAYFSTSDIREAPLIQEIITYLGSLIRSSPTVFSGIMRIRTHFFIIAMREEISRAIRCDEEEAIEHLMSVLIFLI